MLTGCLRSGNVLRLCLILRCRQAISCFVSVRLLQTYVFRPPLKSCPEGIASYCGWWSSESPIVMRTASAQSSALLFVPILREGSRSELFLLLPARGSLTGAESCVQEGTDLAVHRQRSWTVLRVPQ